MDGIRELWSAGAQYCGGCIKLMQRILAENHCTTALCAVENCDYALWAKETQIKAAWYKRNGSARDVLVVGELPTPRPGPGEVLVKLATSGVNPSDVKSRQRRPIQTDYVIPHSDGGGIIHAVGWGVSPDRLGQRVWIWNGQWQRAMGTACEYISLPQAQAVVLPDAIDFSAAACFGIPALTAVQATRLAGPLQGKIVLVTGAGNAVGHYVTQLAAMKGATVIGTAGSAMRIDHAKDAGASHVIDYKTEQVAERITQLTDGEGVDAIIDMDFSTTAKLISQGALKPHGDLVSYGSNDTSLISVDFRSLLWGSLGMKFFLVYDLLPTDRVAATQELTSLLLTNALRHSIGPSFSLEDIAVAHELVESGTQIGNVVIKL
jgi:NADPH2:quinone reductase